MIEFKCHCGQQFSLGNDQAGGLIQCPKCGRLNDIPTLSDLKNLDADGNYKISELELIDEPERLHDVVRAFTRQRVDDSGEEIDLRPSIDDVMRAGVEEIPLADESPPAAPKYDPLTGELIEPLKVKPEPERDPIGALPMATPVLTYSTGAIMDSSDARTWSLWRVGLELLKPVNVFVMIFVMAMQALLVIALIPIVGGIFFLAPLMLFPMMMLIGYFGKVVEETGPGEQDDLPRPLGSVSLREDVWSPFVGVMGAFMLCFWPVALVYLLPINRALEIQLVPLAWAAGAAVFPAVMLTILTSGSIYNLRPDRVLGVIAKSRGAYWGIVLLFVLSQVANLLPMQQAVGGVASSLAPGKINLPVLRMMISMLSWITSLYLALWACFALGILYRRKQDAFPWILQRHEYTNRTRLPLRRPKPTGAKPPPTSPTKRQRLDEIAAMQNKAAERR